PELVEPGKSGWLIPAGAVEPLVAAMAEALTADPAELARMGHAGAARVMLLHNASTQAEKLAGLIADPGEIIGQADDHAFPRDIPPHPTAAHGPADLIQQPPPGMLQV